MLGIVGTAATVGAYWGLRGLVRAPVPPLVSAVLLTSLMVPWILWPAGLLVGWLAGRAVGTVALWPALHGSPRQKLVLLLTHAAVDGGIQGLLGLVTAAAWTTGVVASRMDGLVALGLVPAIVVLAFAAPLLVVLGAVVPAMFSGVVAETVAASGGAP